MYNGLKTPILGILASSYLVPTPQPKDLKLEDIGQPFLFYHIFWWKLKFAEVFALLKKIQIAYLPEEFYKMDRQTKESSQDLLGQTYIEKGLGLRPLKFISKYE